MFHLRRVPPFLFLAGRLAGGLFLGPSPARSQADRSLPTNGDLTALLHERVDRGRGVGIVLGVREADGRTRVEPTNQPKLPIRPESPSEFFIQRVDARITFQRNEAGVVTGLILHQGGRDVPGNEVP